MRKIGLLILVALLIPLALSAARLTLRDGTVVYGQFLNSSFGKIDIQDSRGMRRTFDVRQIREIDFRSSDSSADRYFPGDPIPGARPPRQPAFDSTPPGRDETRYGRTWTTLFPGTVLSIRTSETIDARGTAEGHIYPATIAQDVVDGSGSLVIPRGSEAALLVRKIDEGGALALDLDWVRVNGRRYYVDTSNLRTGSHDDNVGANRRTAVMAGGGAALGALAGALAAGGQGAAIGAAAGAAAGTGVQVLTRGREIRVPAETVLNFRLEDPLQLREAR
jgi:hypothetical protein